MIARPASLVLTLATPEATAKLAATLAPLLGPGDTILLSGEIGAGKTHFCRALIQVRLAAAGRIEDVPSPTFTLVQVYQAEGAKIWHADLYRLGHSDEVVELGLDEAFDGAICLVEWPDRMGTLRPVNALSLTLEVTGEDGRVARFAADDTRWNRVFSALRALGAADG